MKPTEIRFNILKLADYNKPAAEIMVEAIQDNEIRYNLFKKSINLISEITPEASITDKASEAKKMTLQLYDFTGENENKYLLVTECLNRIQSGDPKDRVEYAINEAEALSSIVTIDE
jgi:hypothetical protein